MKRLTAQTGIFLRNSHSHSRASKTSVQEQCIGTLRTPYTGYAEETHRRITLGLFQQHPLSDCISAAALGAWSLLLNYPLETMRGPAIGPLYQHCLVQTLPPPDWRLARNVKREKNIVCIPQPHFSLQVQVSSNLHEQSLFGTPHMRENIRAHSLGFDIKGKQRDGYHLLIKYDLATMQLYRVQFGWAQDVDYFRGRAKRACVPPERMHRQFLTLYQQRLVNGADKLGDGSN